MFPFRLETCSPPSGLARQTSLYLKGIWHQRERCHIISSPPPHPRAPPPLSERFLKDVTSCIWGPRVEAAGSRESCRGSGQGAGDPTQRKSLAGFCSANEGEKLLTRELGWRRQSRGNVGFMELANLNSNIKNAFISLLNPEKFFLA